ncbi:MAG TPA: hypothetical protein VE961_25995 [Pyrinomonadaceae bacterium]|nr:hypothetical protein [Pyrinomonadaceae bacterium]
MNAVAKKQIEADLVDRFGHAFEKPEKRSREVLSSGIGEIDRVCAGFPRGSITEIHGTATSGRTTLMLAALAAATLSEETCALIDCSDTFDLWSATKAQVSFDRLLWVRCHSNLERAFKATDLLLHSGGFGLVALNLADMPSRTLRRIISTWWFRFRRALENTPTVLLVLTPIACARSCAAMALELQREAAVWAASDSFSTRAENQALAPEDCSAKHLSLVATDDRKSPPQPALPNHAHFLRAATVRVNRERPVGLATRPVRFTASLECA